MIKLVRPAMEYADEIMGFRRELLDVDSEFAGCGSLYHCTSAEKWIETVQQNEAHCQEGGVTSNSYIAVRLHDNKVVGVIDLRHHINHPILRVWGGHIGYTVRPSERRKGYATEMLRQNLVNARGLGLDKVLIVCNADNIGSEKTILANGGGFEKEISIDGNVMKRFWIKL